MVRIESKEECCGCNACGDICPKHAISFETDVEGFWYPKIDESKCINCGLCEKVCPVIHPADGVKRFEIPRVYAAYTKDEETRLDSTSGGIHSMLAHCAQQNECSVHVVFVILKRLFYGFAHGFEACKMDDCVNFVFFENFIQRRCIAYIRLVKRDCLADDFANAFE